MSRTANIGYGRGLAQGCVPGIFITTTIIYYISAPRKNPAGGRRARKPALHHRLGFQSSSSPRTNARKTTLTKSICVLDPHGRVLARRFGLSTRACGVAVGLFFDASKRCARSSTASVYAQPPRYSHQRSTAPLTPPEVRSQRPRSPIMASSAGRVLRAEPRLSVAEPEQNAYHGGRACPKSALTAAISRSCITLRPLGIGKSGWVR